MAAQEWDAREWASTDERSLMMFRIIALLLTVTLGAPAVAAEHRNEPKEWNFKVLLDDSEIGFHRFRLSENEGHRELRSEARFDVKVLFFTAYKYRHTTIEYWDDGCLDRIESMTVANGDEISLQGQLAGDKFVVSTNDSAARLPACVMTFAYWNPDFLKQSHLLNPQSGKYLEVDAEAIRSEPVAVRGELVPATRYRLQTGELTLDIWYSQNDEWIALESTAKGGRILRYELS
jgi:hypothetical protein